MKILLLSPFFFPEEISTGKYNTYLAEALALRGHEITVIASHPIYPDWQVKVSDDNLMEIDIKRGGKRVVYPRSAILRRLILELWFTWHICLSFIRLRIRPAIVIPIFPPSLFFMFLLSLLPRTIYKVGIVHDLQGIYTLRSNSHISRALKSMIHFVEKRSFMGCDRLIFLSNSMAKCAIAEYQLNATLCRVCYPFVAIEDKMSVRDDLIDILLPNSFNVVYSGALGEKQNPWGLFNFMSAIASANNNVACHIFSAGPFFSKLCSKSKGLPDCKVQFHDLVPATQLAELYERSDVQIIPQAFGTSEGSLPSKLPNLLITGVQLFVICEQGSELGELVNEANAGFVVNTWDVAELVGNFNTFMLNQSKESKVDRRIRIQEYTQSKFNIDNVIQAILVSDDNQKKGSLKDVT